MKQINKFLYFILFYFFDHVHLYLQKEKRLVGWFCNMSILRGLFHVIVSLIDLVWFGLISFYGISTIVGYLMPNPLYTYILNIYDLVWLGFKAYQP